MSETQGFVYAYGLDGKGGGRALGRNEIQAWDPDKGALWLHLDSNDEGAKEWLLKESGISALTCESLLEQETRPRCLMTEDGLLLILRGVNCNPGEDPEDMVAIRMLFTESRIVTLRYRRVMAIQDLEQALAAGRGPADAGHFLLIAAERIVDRMGDVISELDDRVDGLEDAMVDQQIQTLRPVIADLRRKAIGLRRYIAPQKEVLSRLLHTRISWLAESELTGLREVAERTARFVEDLDSARERAAITQEELNSRTAEEMNRAMYTLSIVAAIFLPLGLITGLLGINVGGIPGSDNRWAFGLVTVSLIALAVGLIAWFRKIRWL